MPHVFAAPTSNVMVLPQPALAAVRSMVGLTLKNWLLILVTLGLYWPFAAVAMARMRLVAMEVTSSVDPADLLARAHGPEGQTLGEASGDFLGFDIGL